MFIIVVMLVSVCIHAFWRYSEGVGSRGLKKLACYC